ncbi:hypothetical protein ACWEN6_24135 [Sphaerisporangium sp. NPDC004334]
MSVIMLPGGVLRVPWAKTVDGLCVDGTRDVRPTDPDYEQWLPFAVTEDRLLADQADEAGRDAEILARWRGRMSA